MKIEQAQLDKVEAKLNKQNALLAVLGTGFWTITFIALWYFVYLYNPTFSPVMLLLSGALVGLAVRFHGKGLTGVFSLIAVLFHTSIVLVAFSLNIVLEGTTWAFLLFGLYAAGVVLAKKVSRIEVPFEEHRAYSYLTYPELHACNKKLKNRWFVVLPVLLVTTIFASYIAITGIVFLNEYQALLQQEQQVQQQRNDSQNKEIDITPTALEQRSNHEILLYSYAYNSGLLFNKRGRRSEVFPRSEYKARALLKYLVKYRDNARAKFILGFLTVDKNGGSLIQAAVEQNDQYARIYSAIQFGCYSNEDLGTQLLKKLKNTASDDYTREEISSILYLGIKEACIDLEQPEFMLSYAINYSED
jgi:hypothetical protein